MLSGGTLLQSASVIYHYFYVQREEGAAGGGMRGNGRAVPLCPSRLDRRRREVAEVAAARSASSDAAVDVQICYMSYSNCKSQYLNKTLEFDNYSVDVI